MHRSKPKTILITRFSALGDVAMTLPVIYDVCRANADRQFVLVSRRFIIGLAQEPPVNLKVVPVDIDNDYRGLWGMMRLAGKLRHDYGIDAMADLHSVLRTWAIGFSMRLHGVTVKRIDKGRREKHALINHKINKPLLHTTQRYRQVFAQLGLDTTCSFNSLYNDDALPTCEIAGEKPNGEKWVAVAPFAAHKGKEYPLPLMRKVVETLAERRDIHVFLFGGGKREREILSQWSADRKNITSVAGIQHTFADELALLTRCDAMVSMDSANMHIASLVAVPVVSVWGATHHYCGFMGYRQDEGNAVQLQLDCRPCSVFGERPCRFGDCHCLTGILPEQIIDKVSEVIFSKN